MVFDFIVFSTVLCLFVISFSWNKGLSCQLSLTIIQHLKWSYILYLIGQYVKFACSFTSLNCSFPATYQSRTDRIVFKLFGKDPNDLPFILRSQVFIFALILTLFNVTWCFILYTAWYEYFIYYFEYQILDWLSHSPTDIESYIRPGCIILTIYLRLEKSTWEEVCF